MGLLDAAIGSAFGLAGEKPVVPKFNRLDLGAEQVASAEGNLGVLPKAGELSSATNALNTEQLQKMLAQTIPGLASINRNVSRTLEDMTAGRLPQDVADLVRRNAAYKGTAGGFSGSSAQTNLSARDLGLTSLDLTQRGIDSASRWLASSRQSQLPGFFDVSQMFLSPQQRVQVELDQNQSQFQQQWLANRVEAMPSPEEQMWMGAVQSETAAISSLAGSAMGSMGGGGGGGGGGGM